MCPFCDEPLEVVVEGEEDDLIYKAFECPMDDCDFEIPYEEEVIFEDDLQ